MTEFSVIDPLVTQIENLEIENDSCFYIDYYCKSLEAARLGQTQDAIAFACRYEELLDIKCQKWNSIWFREILIIIGIETNNQVLMSFCLQDNYIYRKSDLYLNQKIIAGLDNIQ